MCPSINRTPLTTGYGCEILESDWYTVFLKIEFVSFLFVISLDCVLEDPVKNTSKMTGRHVILSFGNTSLRL